MVGDRTHRKRALAVIFAIAVAGFVASTRISTANAQTGKSGKELFEARCAGCHALDRDKEGPRLGGVYGRKAASVASFQYSSALAKSDLTWSEGSLDRWLADPDRLVPDNDMSFRVPNPDDRRSIIEYLKQQPGK